MNTIQEVNFTIDDLTIAGREALLNRGIGNDTAAASGQFYHARIFPLKASVGTVRDKVLADLTLSDFDGAAQQQITFVPAVLDETGEPYCLAQRIAFVPTGDATIGSQEVIAIGMVGSDSVTLLGAKDLLDPVTVNFTGSVTLNVDTTLALKPPVNPQ